MKKFILLTIALIIASQHTALAQGPSDRDSLRAIAFDYSLPDTIRLQTALDLLARYYRDQGSDSLLYYSRLFYEESVKADYIRGMVRFKNFEGSYYSTIGKNNEALKCFLDALKFAEKSGQPRLMGGAANEVGSGYKHLLMYDKASEYFLRALAINLEVNDLNGEISTLTNLGSVYNLAGYTQKAEDAYLRVISLIDSLKIGPVRKAAALSNLAHIYTKGGKPVEAMRAFHEAADLFEQNNIFQNYYITLVNLSEFLTICDTLNLYGKEIGDSRESLDIALDYIDQCESWWRKLQDSSKLVAMQIIKARIYVEKGDSKKALDCAREAEKWSFSNEDPGTKSGVLYNLALIYDDCGDYTTAV